MSSKRPRANSDPTLAPAPKKQRGPIPDVSTQSTSSQKTHPDRISKKDQKKETATVKAALEVHYNVIAQRLDPMECPTLPSADDFNKFLNIQYATRDEIQEALKKVRPSSEDNKKFAADVRELKVKVSSQKGRYATAYCAISVDWLTYFIASIHKLGLEHLRFDFLGSSVDSLYNETMELILIKTFSRACQGRAYDFLSVNRAIAEDFETVQSLWRSYFEFLRHEAVTEAREPGALRRRKMASYIYRHRSEKAKHRSAFLQRHGLPERVWKPFEEVFANSDEEYITEKGSNDKVITKRVRNLKIGRSATWTSLARLADQARWKEMEGMGQATKIAHEKLVIDNPKANDWRTFTSQCTRRFFSAELVQQSTSGVEKHYENSAIGLPLDLGGDDIDCWETWLSLSESDFMRVHGKSIRENYKFPNSKELNVRRRKRKYHRPEPPKFKWKSLYGSEYDGDDDDDDDDEDDDGNGNGKGGRAREWSPMQEDQQDGDSTMEDSANGMGQEDGQPSGGSEDGSEGGTKGKRGNNQEGESDAHMDTSGGPSSPSRPTSLAANSLRPAAIGSQKSPDRPSFSSNSAASGPSANRFGPSAAATRTSYDSLDPSQVQSVYRSNSNRWIETEGTEA
ncbi:hypothetical protein DL96DRAFT_1717987 [Flagelloscypha sp. PMI_526]|nr:hypothetical protein DL96DRAFT_1717987 [Flagelloscypha sp. PMI_526]